MTTTTEQPPRTPEEIEANIVKLRAEADLAAAKARREAAEAQTAEVNATIMGFELRQAEEIEAAKRVSDWHLRKYQFEGEVSAASVKKCIDQLRQWDRLDKTRDIEVVFLSPGGSVIHGMALFDELVRLSKRGGGTHELTVGAQGFAASMAGILLQAGDIRWIGQQSYLMIHEISAGTGGKIGEIKDDVKFYEAICERVTKIFVERSEGKCSRQKFVKGWTRTDWWLMSDEALKLGFVDEVR